MARLIDENDIYALFEKNGIARLHVGDIDVLPRVDAVEVVRCEKCLYRSQYPDENGYYKCGGLLTEDEELLLMVKPDFFCAYGERRDNHAAD